MLRDVLLVVGLGLFTMLMSVRSARALDALLLICSLLLVGGVVATHASQPVLTPSHDALDVLFMFVIAVVVPNRFLFQAVPLVGLAIASILHGLGGVSVVANSWTVVVTFSAASIIGVVTAWTGNVAERRLFRAREEVLTLHGVVPICAKCKMIRDNAGDWHQMESYISQRTDAEFTHGLCPSCFRGEMSKLDSMDTPSTTN